MSDYPGGADFVFTIFDDTDVATLEYIRPIYDFLSSLNMFTTKTVWPLSYSVKCDYTGSHTLEDQDYADYIKRLDRRGFEISYHGATMASSTRPRILESLEVFKETLGYYPKSYAPHSLNRDNLYWGESRFSHVFFRQLYRLLSREKKDFFQGHIKGSPFFWGDKAKSHIDYVRNFTYNDINLLNINKRIVYASSRQSFAKSWFISSDADNVEEFNRLISEKNIDRLVRENGVCILSTHFGKGFLKDGALHPRTRELLTRIGKQKGWFAPVSDVLAFFNDRYGIEMLSYLTRFKLEMLWFVHSYRRKKTSLAYDKTELDYL